MTMATAKSILADSIKAEYTGEWDDATERKLRELLDSMTREQFVEMGLIVEHEE